MQALVKPLQMYRFKFYLFLVDVIFLDIFQIQIQMDKKDFVHMPQ